jgi:hypothetical protein
MPPPDLRANVGRVHVGKLGPHRPELADSSTSARIPDGRRVSLAAVNTARSRGRSSRTSARAWSAVSTRWVVYPRSFSPVQFDDIVQSKLCHARQILNRVGDKWSILLVYELGGGSRRFTELRRAIDGISERMLTATVRTLERELILTKVAE